LPALWLIIEYLWAPLFVAFILTVAAIGLHEYGGMAFAEDRAARAGLMLFGLLVAASVIAGMRPWTGAALSVAVIGGLVFALFRHGDLPLAVGRLGLLTVYSAMGSDSGAYFAGRAYGRRKLMPAVSPSKTVEGAVGGLVGAAIIGAICWLVFFHQLPLGETLGVAVGIGLLAQLGDLCESALKRAFGAKDSGWIIPGHGGILDRLDSLLFPFVFSYYYYAVATRAW